MGSAHVLKNFRADPTKLLESVRTVFVVASCKNGVSVRNSDSFDCADA